MVPRPSQTTVAVCNHITPLILYYISPRQETLLKVTDARIQVSDSQTTVAVCNHITPLILYYISPRQETLLKVTDARIQVSDISGQTVSFKFISFSLQIFLLLFLICLLASHLTLFRLSTIIRFGCCKHCILASFLWSKNHGHLHQSMF